MFNGLGEYEYNKIISKIDNEDNIRPSSNDGAALNVETCLNEVVFSNKNKKD